MPSNHKFNIGIIGNSLPSPEEYKLAEETGRLLAKNGATIVCGGLGGVMEAGCKGAKSAGGLTIGILPGILVKEANPFVDIPIPTGIGEARNIIIIRACSAVIAIGGGYGTLSEIAFALKLGVSVIGLNTWDLEKSNKEKNNIIKAKNPEDAVQKAIGLAKLNKS